MLSCLVQILNFLLPHNESKIYLILNTSHVLKCKGYGYKGILVNFQAGRADIISLYLVGSEKLPSVGSP